MSTRTMARIHRASTEHTDWCVRDHTCGIDTHRGRPITIAPDTGGRAIVTRVRAGDRDYAEITMRVPLHRTDSLAGKQLNALLWHLRSLLAAVAALRPGTLTGRTARRAIDSRRGA
ncbi:hypothetical protein Aca07nite_27860 [Actinoplanes capillaceus]|uniref:Transposase n=1 Tax=Actinoplanes campanulatus TaxID=113559 RepID=A0ABQ3WGZ5_9ACTN|nr:hypothetical protein [Actinoplanes capillaceus]GID45511.1 hypothetical protein Aca07nite_27860 [Actinoplanes capillaceus]